MTCSFPPQDEFPAADESVDEFPSVLKWRSKPAVASISVSLPNLLGKSSSNLSDPDAPVHPEQILEGDNALQTVTARCRGQSPRPQLKLHADILIQKNKTKKKPTSSICCYREDEEREAEWRLLQSHPSLHQTCQVAKPKLPNGPRSVIRFRHYIIVNLRRCVEGERKAANETGASLLSGGSACQRLCEEACRENLPLEHKCAVTQQPPRSTWRLKHVCSCIEEKKTKKLWADVD